MKYLQKKEMLIHKNYFLNLKNMSLQNMAIESRSGRGRKSFKENGFRRD